MAMLAEPKRKKKWSLNPRGKLWCNDDSKIGQKLLEKMGWAKGKGLGRDEQGDLEPIRLKYKNDSEGVGFEVKNDQWIAHREEFNNILEALNGSNTPLDETDITATQSLESRSKNSKSRVHYHKFTRGKDLSRYSAADMACILGKRTNSEADQETKDVRIKEEPTKESVNGSVEHLHGVTTIQRGCIQEYFESKMAAVKEKQRKSVDCKQEDSGHEGSNNSDDGGKDEKRVRINEDLNVVKEFRSKEKISKTEKFNQKDDAVVNETIEDISPKKKKKGSKTKFEEESAGVPSKPLPVTEEIVDNVEIKKKKKKKLEKEIPEPVVDAEPVKTKKSKIEEIADSTVEIIVNGEGVHTQEESKKKKKKAKKQEEEAVECEQMILKGEEDHTQEEPKKKKKKSKKPEEAIETSNFEVIEPVQKKSKKNKTVEVSVEQVQNEEDVQPPIKKKKKKNKEGEQEAPEKYTKLDDSSVESVQAMQITASKNQQNGLEQDVEQETKKKKKSKQTEEEVPETFHKMENTLEKTETKRNKKGKNKPSDKIEVELIKKNKKIKGTAVEAPEVQDKTSEDAQVNPPKEKIAKKRKACDMTDEVAINGKEGVGCVQLADEELQERKTVNKKVGSEDQLARQAEAKPNGRGKEVDQPGTKNISAILIEAGAAADRRKLESIQLSDGSRISQKLNRKLMRAKFDKFVGSNLLTIVGYGSDGASLT